MQVHAWQLMMLCMPLGAGSNCVRPSCLVVWRAPVSVAALASCEHTRLHLRLPLAPRSWRDILHVVDIVCCCLVLFPIVWSIKQLRDASGERRCNGCLLQVCDGRKRRCRGFD